MKRNNRAFIMLYVIAVVGFAMTAMAYVTITFNLQLENNHRLVETADKINAEISAQNVIWASPMDIGQERYLSYEVDGRQYKINMQKHESEKVMVKVCRQ